jgi:hypothetical protein
VDLRRGDLFDEQDPEPSEENEALLDRISELLGDDESAGFDLSQLGQLKPDLLRVFCEMLDSHGYQYIRVSPLLVRMVMADEVGTFEVMVNTRPEIDYIGVVTRYGPRVPWEMRPAVAEAILTLNNGIAIGHFEIDPEDGELRFRHGRDTEHTGFNVEEAAQMLNYACWVTTQNYSKLMKVTYGAVTPAEIA